jgi:hypothetical protein
MGNAATAERTHRVSERADCAQWLSTRRIQGSQWFPRDATPFVTHAESAFVRTGHLGQAYRPHGD